MVDLIASETLPEHVSLQPIACMSGCRRACAVDLLAEGKTSYLFGDLPNAAAAA